MQYFVKHKTLVPTVRYGIQKHDIPETAEMQKSHGEREFPGKLTHT